MAREDNRQSVLWIAAIALIYFATARFSLTFLFHPEGVASIWPPGGIFLSAILLTRRELRPWLVGVLFMTDLLAERLAGTPLVVSAVYAFALSGDAVLSAWLLLRFVGEPITCRRVRDVVGLLVLATMLSNALWASVATLASQLFPTTTFADFWIWWAASDGVGTLLVAPLILSWASLGSTGLRAGNYRRVLEGAVLFIFLALLNYAAFWYLEEHTVFSLLHAYLTFPLLLWAALRFGVCGVSAALLILAAIAVQAAGAGRDAALSAVASHGNAVLLVQLYLALMAVPSLLLAAAVEEREQSHDALGASEQRFRALFEQAAVGVAQVETATGRFVRVNQRYGDIVGYSRSEMEAISEQTLTHPDDLRVSLEKLRALAAGRNAACSMEKRYRRKDGTVVWVVLTASPMWTPSEEPRHYVAVVEDITDRKRAEFALARNEARLRAVLESEPECVKLLGPNCTLLDINAAGLRMIEAASLEQVAGRSILDLVLPAYRTAFSELHDRAWRGESGILEFEIQGLKGTRRWLETHAAPLYAESGRIESVLGITRDITERKRAEEALHESEAKYRTLFENAGDAIFLMQNDRFIDCNARALELYGCQARDQIVGHTPYEFSPPRQPNGRESRESALEKIGAALAGKPQFFEWVHTKFDGTSFSVEVSLNRMEMGGEVLLQAIVRDITDRQRAAEALRDKEHLLSESQRIAHIGSWLYKMGDQISWSDEMFRIYGVSPDTFAPTVESFIGLINSDDRPAMRAWLAACAAGEKPGELEFRVNMPDGSIRYISGHGELMYDSSHRHTHMAGSAQDITERKRAEEDLRHRREKLAALNSLSREVSASLELDAVVSAGLREMLGAVRADVAFLFLREGERLILTGIAPAAGRIQLGQIPEHRVGECVCGLAVKLGRTLYSRDILSDLRCTWDECKKAGLRSFVALPLRSGDQTIGVIGLASASERDFESQGGFLETLASAVSVSLQNARLFSETRRAREALEEAARRKDEFLAALGHELRNPLMPICNAVYALKVMGLPDSKAEQARAMIERQATHLSRIVDDLLDVARIERGRITLRKERVNWSELVRQSVDDFRSELERKGIPLALALPPEPVWVMGDPTRLAQVMSNLLNNALKFGDAGGHIAITMQVPPNENTVVLTVKDAGIGMTPETIQRIFEPFMQAQTDLARSRGGLGLGLALVKGLLELHGGSIKASSAGLRQGSEFTVRLPLLSVPPVPDTGLPVSKTEHLLRILIVEDNLDAAESLRMILELAGHAATVALAGAVGLQTARQIHPDVIVCDIGLPGGMDGYAVAREIRKDAALHSVYLIAMTGYGQEEDKRRAREAGFDQHVTKPVDPNALERLLASVPVPAR